MGYSEMNKAVSLSLSSSLSTKGDHCKRPLPKAIVFRLALAFSTNYPSALYH